MIALNEVPWILYFSSCCTFNLIASSLTALPTNMNGIIEAIVASHNILSALETPLSDPKRMFQKSYSGIMKYVSCMLESPSLS
jgi:hypothetical protein